MAKENAIERMLKELRKDREKASGKVPILLIIIIVIFILLVLR